LFPNLENVDGLDNRVLAFMVHGLRETSQSIEIGLIEPCIKSFSQLFRQKFGAESPRRVVKADLIDVTLQALDDAERMVKKVPPHKVRVAHSWVDPRYDTESFNGE
jgi:hypothetical protein